MSQFAKLFNENTFLKMLVNSFLYCKVVRKYISFTAIIDIGGKDQFVEMHHHMCLRIGFLSNSTEAEYQLETGH